ncbi:MAG: restriction endonuclease, partial [bacterium]|nr:restriction endonuclease [bacterium]
MAKSSFSRSNQLVAKVTFAALNFLKDNGGEAAYREVIAAVEKRVSFDDWEREAYKDGTPRWRRYFAFDSSILAVKAGYILKKAGRWFLTPDGENALQLGAEELHRRALSAYKQFIKERDQQVTPVETEVEDAHQAMAATLQQIEQEAIEGIRAQIYRLNPYEFQDLVEALLRGMGYHTPFSAPRGKDGGMDVIAYRDPLGTQSPRMTVQDKLRENPASGPDVRQLLGVLQRDDVGIFVSAGGFTPDARQAATGTQVHVEL